MTYKANFFLFVLLLLSVLNTSSQVPFTPGNVVVCRVDNGSAQLTTSATAVFLDEYTPAGIFVQSIAMPTIANSPNNILTTKGNTIGSPDHGNLSLSVNGQYLVLAGYSAPVGTPGAGSGLAGPRVIGLVDNNGSINTSTALTDIGGTSILTAVSTDGTDLWCAGTNNLGDPFRGVHYTITGSTTSTQLNSGLPNGLRALLIANGQLYVSSTNTGFRIMTVGTGTPTTSGQTLINLPGFPIAVNGPTQFVFFDLDAAVPGMDVLYVADYVNGIQKYSLNGAGNWVPNGIVGVAADYYHGVTGTVSNGIVTLYATRRGPNSPSIIGGQLVKVIDASGYNSPFSATPVVLATVSAPNNMAFRGVALAPGCFTPTAPLVTNITTTTADVNWISSTGALKYEYAVTTSNQPPPSGTDTTGMTHLATGLVPGTQYYVHIRGVCSLNGSYSSWITKPFSTLAPVCNFPSTQVITNNTGTSVTIKWNTVIGATGYQYVRSDSAVPPSFSGTDTNDTTYVDSNLAVATTYYFYVRSKCGSNNYSSWTMLPFTTICPKPPAASIVVTGLHADISISMANGVGSYEYAVSTNSNPPASGETSTSANLSLNDLPGATKFYLHVRSDCGQGVFSTWTTTPFSTGCLKPQPFITAERGVGNVTISWKKISGGTSYEYAILTYGSPPPVGSAAITGDTILRLTNLKAGLKYRLYIRTHCNENEMSDWASLEFHSTGIDVFPNPAATTVTIHVYGVDINNGELLLTDIAGKKIWKKRLTSSVTDMDMSGIASGVYVLKYKDQRQEFSTKILKR